MCSRRMLSTGQKEAPVELNLPTTEEEYCPENPLYLNPKLSDVIFLVGGERLHAHKAILAAKSKHFDRLFEENCEKKEITILNTSPKSFRHLLKYIYTDIVTIPSDIAQMLQLLILAHQHDFGRFESRISETIKNILDANNVVYFVNGANNHDLDDLRDVCHSFIDAHGLQFLTSDSFNDLTQKSLIQLMKRDHRLGPEIDIFNSVARWCERNNNNVVAECVRLSLLTQSEIVFIVWPTKLVNPEKLLEAISAILRAKDLGEALDDATTAIVPRGTKGISFNEFDVLLTGNTEVEKHIKHIVGDVSGIIIRLHGLRSFNHIRMKLYDADLRYYSYYIETSDGEKMWHKIVDYSSYSCRSVQNLYFDPQLSQYIRVVGTSTSVGNDFRLVSFEALYESKIPRMQIGMICPEANVATPENGAIVLEGEDPQYLLDGNVNNICATHHQINSTNSNGIIVRLSQPYVISSMRLLLGFSKDSYRYFIETSVNKRDWKLAIDRRNGEFTKWQDLHFAERAVVFIKITGTYCSESDNLWCSHFECPSEGEK